MLWFLLALARLARSVRRGMDDPEFRALFILLVVLLGIGTAFYTVVEGWSVVDSLYFCVSTLSTVGFGDFTPTKDESKLFTIVYLLIGVGVFVGIAGKLGRELLREPGRPARDETDEAPN